MDALLSQFTNLSPADREIVLSACASSIDKEMNRLIADKIAVDKVIAEHQDAAYKAIVEHQTAVEKAIAADTAMVHTKLAEARAQGVKTIELQPSWHETLFEVMDLCIKQIQPMERIRVTIPMIETHFVLERPSIDSDFVRGIADEYEGSKLPNDVFVVLRYNDDKWTANVADIYRAPE